MSFEEYLLLAANGDTKLAFDPKFREQQAPNWLRYLKEIQPAIIALRAALGGV